MGMLLQLGSAVLLLCAAVYALWPLAAPVADVLEQDPTPNPAEEIGREGLTPLPREAFDVVLWTPPPRQQSPAVSEPVAPVTPPRTDLVLVAIQTDGDDRAAVFRDPATGRLVWLRPGESIGDMAVTDIGEYEVVLEIGSRQTSRTLRRSSP